MRLREGLRDAWQKRRKEGSEKGREGKKNKEEKMEGGKDAERFLPFILFLPLIFISFLPHLSVFLALCLFQGIKGGKEAGME